MNTDEQKTQGNNLFDRRDFLKTSGLLSAGLLFSPYAVSGATASSGISNGITFPKDASLHLTPFWILHSSSKLAVASEFIDSGFKHCMRQDVDTAKTLAGNHFRLGMWMSYGKSELLDSLEKARNSNHLDFEMSRRLSLVSGALANRAAMNDMNMNVTPLDETSDSESVREERVYQDATILRTYLDKGKIYQTGDEVVLKRYFQNMVPRTLLRFHTLRPDVYEWPDINAGMEWVINMASWRNKVDAYFTDLGNAVAHPDSGKVQKYITDPNFFEKTDSLLVKVSTFARVRDIDRNGAEEAVENGRGGSACAKGISAAYEAIISINDYLAGTIDKQQLSNRLRFS